MRLGSLRANADSVGFNRNAFVSYINVVIASGEKRTG
jgi:hypothetical protein